jgi:hypothetical protein
MKSKKSDKSGKFGRLKKLSIKKPQFKRPSLKNLRRKTSDVKINQAIENLPRITNETVAEHREEMLSSARKFIYPLQHSRQRIVKVSIALFVIGLLVFMGYVLLALYRFQSSSTFIYGVTRVLPLPAAKVGGNWVSYESYLFELRHLKHYYETQQDVNFNTESGRAQLQEYRKQAMDQAVNDAYVKQLAEQNGVSVSGGEVEDAVRMLRDQNRLGNSDQEFNDVLKEFWGWDASDFKRELRQQLLAQKVVAKLDTQAGDKIRVAQAQLSQGGDFAAVAKQVADASGAPDSSGEYAFLIDRSNRDVAPKVVDALFRLQPGQVSDIVDTGYTLEIVKVISADNGKIRASHISVAYKPIESYIKPLRDKTPPKKYIGV